MKILIIGASSYLGARLFYDLNGKFDLTGTYQSTKLSQKFVSLDIRDSRAVDDTIKHYRPDFILHVAANSSPEWCEANQNLAIELNQIATGNIVNAANKYHSKIIYISSFAAINPTTVYGKTKLEAEKNIKKTKAGYLIIRPSLIIGNSPNTESNHSFNRILRNIRQKKVSNYDTSWKFQPTYIGHISDVISKVIEKNILNETISIAVRQRKSKYDIAKDISKSFSVRTIPVNNQDTNILATNSLNKLKELELPLYSYDEVIKKIILEIKNSSMHLD